MTKIKLCGLSRPCDIEAANKLKPDYIGFVFAPKSKRYVAPEQAMALKQMLLPEIQAVGVFVNEDPKNIAKLLRDHIIDMAQLHGGEDEAYIARLRQLTDQPIIQAFRVGPSTDLKKIEQSTADYVLLDSGAGTGTVFDWALIQKSPDRISLPEALTLIMWRTRSKHAAPMGWTSAPALKRADEKTKTKWRRSLPP